MTTKTNTTEEKVEAAAERLMSVCERLANTPMNMSLGDWGECSVAMREAAATIVALVAERDEALSARKTDELEAQLHAVRRAEAERGEANWRERATTAESALATAERERDEWKYMFEQCKSKHGETIKRVNAANARVERLEKALTEIRSSADFAGEWMTLDKAQAIARTALTGGNE